MLNGMISVFVFFASVIVGGLSGTMCTGLLVSMKGDHKGKIRTNNQWASFWRLFTFTFLEAIFLYFLFTVISPYVETFLRVVLVYDFGIIFLVTGLFFLWFVYSFDFDITTQWKWVFPVVCFGISIANLLIVNWNMIFG